MALKNTDKHLKKAYDDEYIFILLARDQCAPEVVIEWIKQSIHSQPADKLREALELAINMKRTQSTFQKRALNDKMERRKQTRLPGLDRHLDEEM